MNKKQEFEYKHWTLCVCARVYMCVCVFSEPRDNWEGRHSALPSAHKEKKRQRWKTWRPRGGLQSTRLQCQSVCSAVHCTVNGHNLNEGFGSRDKALFLLLGTLVFFLPAKYKKLHCFNCMNRFFTQMSVFTHCDLYFSIPRSEMRDSDSRQIHSSQGKRERHRVWFSLAAGLNPQPKISGSSFPSTGQPQRAVPHC